MSPNIHSTFGSTVAERQAEATAAATFFTSLKSAGAGGISVPAGGFPVVIAGDWNLPARYKNGTLNAGFQALVSAGAGIEPNVLTSLNSTGGASSAYDHFVFTVANLQLSNIELNPANPGEWQAWRGSVSDHLGVIVDVTLH